MTFFCYTTKTIIYSVHKRDHESHWLWDVNYGNIAIHINLRSGVLFFHRLCTYFFEENEFKRLTVWLSTPTVCSAFLSAVSLHLCICCSDPARFRFDLSVSPF